MSKVVLNDLVSPLGTSAVALMNDNNSKIEAAIENTLSRDGTTPNQMEADIDLNSNDLLNAGDIQANTASITTLTSTTVDATNVVVTGGVTVGGQLLTELQGPPGPAGAAGTNGTNGTNGAGVPAGGTSGQILKKNSNADYDTVWYTASGTGTVTTVSVVSANGFTGSVANATTTPAITIATSITGLLKGNGTAISAAVAGTDYEVPLTFSTGLTRSTNTITVNTSQNISTLSNLTSNGSVQTSGGTGALSVVANTGSGNNVLATSPTLVTPLLGTPTSGTLTNCTGYVISNLASIATGMATFLTTPSSANLAATVTDETGSGALVFAASPALTGSPTAPTQSALDNSTKLATTAYAQDADTRYVGYNAQTGTTYTLVLGDAGSLIEVSNASAITLTIPLNSSVAFPLKTVIDIIQTGAGQITISPTGGVTLTSAGSAVKTRVQYSGISLIKVATDTWRLIGDIA